MRNEQQELSRMTVEFPQSRSSPGGLVPSAVDPRNFNQRHTLTPAKRLVATLRRREDVRIYQSSLRSSLMEEYLFERTSYVWVES